MSLQLVVVSDTHGQHRELTLPEADLLVHCGDLCKRGTRTEWLDALDWLAAAPAQARVVVPGNRDHASAADPAQARQDARSRGIHLLLAEPITLLGLHIYGAPWTPQWRKGAWQQPDLSQAWAGIQPGLDLLITHTPAYGIGDLTWRGSHVGCPHLRQAIDATAPAMHLFGHIHEARGQHSPPGARTRSYNTANKPLLLGALRPPTLITL